MAANAMNNNGQQMEDPKLAAFSRIVVQGGFLNSQELLNLYLDIFHPDNCKCSWYCQQLGNGAKEWTKLRRAESIFDGDSAIDVSSGRSSPSNSSLSDSSSSLLSPGEEHLSMERTVAKAIETSCHASHAVQSAALAVSPMTSEDELDNAEQCLKDAKKLMDVAFKTAFKLIQAERHDRDMKERFCRSRSSSPEDEYSVLSSSTETLYDFEADIDEMEQRLDLVDVGGEQTDGEE